MTPQRRTALVSVLAAAALVALKLAVGLVAHSLGLVSEAAHSGTDLVAALLTFVAVGFLIAWQALVRLIGSGHRQVNPAWYAIAVVVVVMAIDVARAVVSARA